MKKSPQVARLYRGIRVEERQAERRSQLIDAAILVYGEVGYRNATVKAVCEKARLTERYFYESFDNSEALLLAAYAQVTDELHKEMAAAGSDFAGDAVERAAAVLGLYFTRLRERPQAARVFLLEIAGISEAVDIVRINVLRAMAGTLVPSISDARSNKGAGSMTLLSIGMIGAVVNIALRWVSQGYKQPIQDVVSTAVAFCRVALSETAVTPKANTRSRYSSKARIRG